MLCERNNRKGDGERREMKGKWVKEKKGVRVERERDEEDKVRRKRRKVF